MRANVRFYPSAAAAQRAGFRACKRCRPNATPGSPEWDTRADVVARAMRLIADGLVDREGVSGAGRPAWGTASASWNGCCRRRSVPGPSPSPGPNGPRPPGCSSRRQPCPWPTSPSPPDSPASASSTTPIKTVFASSPTHLRARVGEATRSDGGGLDHPRPPSPVPPAPVSRQPHRAPGRHRGPRRGGGPGPHLPAHPRPGPRPGHRRAHPHPRPHPLSRHPLRHAGPDRHHRPVPLAPRSRCRPDRRRQAPGRSTPPCARSSTRLRADGSRVASTEASWPSGRCSANRCRPPRPGPTPVDWWRATGSR